MQVLEPLAVKPSYRDFAVIVVIILPGGEIPLVKERRPNRIAFLKIPGGKRDGDETPAECGIREVEEETGIVLQKDQLIFLYQEDRGTHDYYVFGVKLSERPKLKTVGDEGEEIGVFSRDGLKDRKDFFPGHKDLPPVMRFIYG